MKKFFSILVLIVFANFISYSQTYSTFNVTTYHKVAGELKPEETSLAKCKFTFTDNWVKLDWDYDHITRYYRVKEIFIADGGNIYTCWGPHNSEYTFIIDNSFSIYLGCSKISGDSEIFKFDIE